MHAGQCSASDVPFAENVPVAAASGEVNDQAQRLPSRRPEHNDDVAGAPHTVVVDGSSGPYFDPFAAKLYKQHPRRALAPGLFARRFIYWWLYCMDDQEKLQWWAQGKHKTGHCISPVYCDS
jgi:hypothetical protein